MIALNAGKGGKTWSVLGLNASLTSLPFIIKDKSTQNRKKQSCQKSCSQRVVQISLLYKHSI